MLAGLPKFRRNSFFTTFFEAKIYSNFVQNDESSKILENKKLWHCIFASPISIKFLVRIRKSSKLRKKKLFFAKLRKICLDFSQRRKMVVKLSITNNFFALNNFSEMSFLFRLENRLHYAWQLFFCIFSKIQECDRLLVCYLVF